MPKKSLKSANRATITIFLIFNISVFLVSSQGFDNFWTDIHARMLDLKATDSLFTLLTPVILVIVNGLMPASLKACLVFWRIKNPLPGCRVFSEIAPNDHRLDMQHIEDQLGVLPTSPKEQNALWYKIFKSVSDSITVSEAHKHFLLCRDMTSIAAMFFLVGSPALYPAGASITNIIFYVTITFSELVIISIVARNHGNRFTCNVLTEI